MKPLHYTHPTLHIAEERILNGAADDDAFLGYARTCTRQPFSVVLLSGGKARSPGNNRYSIAGWDPLLIFKSKGTHCTLTTAYETSRIQSDPLQVLDRLFPAMPPEESPRAPLLPFAGGAMGYFAYDLKNSIEKLPQTATDDLDLPDILLSWPGKILIHDRLEKELRLLTLATNRESPAHSPIPHPSRPAEVPLKVKAGELQSNFSHEAYLHAVRTVRDYIREGDAYQVNLSQRYQFSFEGEPFELWTAMFHLNPAPFYAYVHGGDHHVLSTSMERFLYRRDSYVETRPIKGTRKRGKTPGEDDLLARDLLQNPKDDSELSMIVDLLRNDLGRVCKPRSIRVEEHKRLETYRNVHHLVSIVKGQLRENTTYGEILRATFPGGSITGCPKIRAMEIIDELEPNVRHIYTGAIGYLGCQNNLDLNIAIRTAIVRGNTCYFSVGGGIVYDSNEEDEYQETLHKGRTLFQLIEKIGKTAV